MKEPRSRNLTPFGKWLFDNRYSDRDFADLMMAERKLTQFSASTVQNWRYGFRTPNGENLKAISRLTGLTTDQILGVGDVA